MSEILTESSGMSSAQAAVIEDEAPSPAQVLKARILELDSKKRTLEVEVQQALELLSSTSVGINGALVDAEGFPRADLDLYAIRDARHTVACGTNDLKAIDEELHDSICKLHESTSRADIETQMAEDDARRAQAKRETEKLRLKLERDAAKKKLTPFLLVVAVVDGSPAFDAGLRVGDVIVELGDSTPDTAAAAGGIGASGIGDDGLYFNATHMKAGGVAALAAFVRRHEGALMVTWARRVQQQQQRHGGGGDDGGEVVALPLVPQRWKGDGLLGFTFEPLQLV